MMLLLLVVLSAVVNANVLDNREGVYRRESEQQASTSLLYIQMPEVHPSQEDAYICTSKVVPTGNNYIIEFKALAQTERAHHLLLYGCDVPYRQSGSWDLDADGAQICFKGRKILFAWAKNADPTRLPNDVGFEIGENVDVKWLVLQIHYRNPIAKSERGDTSGVQMLITSVPQHYIAGIYILMSVQANIPGQTEKVHSDISCKFKGKTAIYPFAFRPHAHDLGRVISGYVHNKTGWYLLGKGNPQWPQAFYPIEGQRVILPGDDVIGRCTYNSTGRDRSTFIGGAHTDEMCNFYMMYYTERETGGESYYSCSGNNYPALLSEIPADSDTPLASHPELEEMAAGHAHKEPVTPPTFDIPASSVSVVTDWPKQSNQVVLGQIAGVDTDSEGRVYLFHRGTVVWDQTSFNVRNRYTMADSGPISIPTIIVISENGTVVEHWGEDMFYMPHGLTVDHHDNVWITDVALHQVMRFPKGKRKPDLVLGNKLEPGYDDESFCKPTSVAVLQSGEFFVADGYCNNRIVKYSKVGTKLREWGKSTQNRGDDGFPPPYELLIPHSLTIVDELGGGAGKVCVADRENGRIQCFDFDGNFLQQMHPSQFQGHVYAVAYSSTNRLLYAVNGPNSFNDKVKIRGFTLDATSGELLEEWAPPHGFTEPHAIAVSPSGANIYVVEIQPINAWKFQVNVAKIPQSGTVHQSAKKAGSSGHPSSVDASNNERLEDQIEKETEESTDFGASLVIGGLLIIPVMVIVSVTVFLRLRKNAQSKGYRPVVDQEEQEEDEEHALWVRSQRGHSDIGQGHH